jgi:CBS domain containing-hemolysin-like protein
MLLAALLLLYLALLGLLAVISAAETAIHSASDLEQQLLSAGEGSVARRLREITVNPFAQLQRMLLMSAALNLSLVALGLWIVAGPLRSLGWQPWLAGLLLFGVTVVFGDILPKFLATRSPSAVLLGSLRLLRPRIARRMCCWRDSCRRASKRACQSRVKNSKRSSKCARSSASSTSMRAR